MSHGAVVLDRDRIDFTAAVAETAIRAIARDDLAASGTLAR